MYPNLKNKSMPIFSLCNRSHLHTIQEIYIQTMCSLLLKNHCLSVLMIEQGKKQRVVFLATQRPHIRLFNSHTITAYWKGLVGPKSSSYSSRMAQSFCSTLINGRMGLDQLLMVLEMDSCFTRLWPPNIMSLRCLGPIPVSMVY